MSESGHDSVSVESLVEDFLARRQAGEPVTMEQLIEQHPELADQIRDVLPALEALNCLSSDWKQSVSRRRSGFALPYQLGVYRLEREIGRGGMGVVYEAQHAQLQRRVAIKVLAGHAVHADQGIERFHREARAAAGLHHTNIIPVFNFGEHDGLYFIAMQLIRGAGLDRVIAELRHGLGDGQDAGRQDTDHLPPPGANTDEADNAAAAAAGAAVEPAVEHEGERQRRASPGRGLSGDHVPAYGTTDYWRFVATIGVQAAQAVQYAHSQGTIHRDLKPANLLLDHDGNVWVADFGLALQSDSGHWTQTNSLAGTLRYLSPEQFQGICNALTDQYGLGVTLYELLTLRSATGHTTTQAEVMRAIAESRIRAPRSVNADVPVDLETIVMKAVSRDPADRYTDCHHLADDLQRFLDGRSVMARPPGPMEQLVKWSRRNPGLAASFSVTALALVLVAGSAVMAYSQERQARQAETEKAQAESESIIATREVVEEKLVAFSGGGLRAADDSSLLSRKVLTTDVAEVLGSTFGLYLSFVDRAEAGDDDPTWTIGARKRLGDFHQQLNNFEAAIEEYDAAVAAWRSLSSEQQKSLRLTLAAVYNELGTCCLFVEDATRSAAWHAQALTTLRALPETPEVRYETARTYYLASRELRVGESPVGRLPENTQGPGRRTPPGNGPRGRGPRGPGGGMLPAGGIGRFLFPSDRFGPDNRREPPQPMGLTEQQRQQLDQAISLLESLQADGNESVRSRYLLAHCYASLAGGAVCGGFGPHRAGGGSGRPDSHAAVHRSSRGARHSVEAGGVSGGSRHPCAAADGR